MCKNIILLTILIIFLNGCSTIEKKSDEIVQKENKTLSKYIGRSSERLLADLGKPDEDFINEKGNLEYVYKKKKYGISCERTFEINSKYIVNGFTSKNCF